MQSVMRSVAFGLLMAGLTSRLVAQQPVAAPSRYELPDQVGTARIRLQSGGEVKIYRGLGAVSNRSSLELEWITVTDSTMGLVFDGPIGAKGIHDDPWYRYNVDVKIVALKPIAAFEVRVLTFDVWRQFTATLSFSQLEDLKVGQKKSFDRLWGIYGESQLRDHFTSIAYVARVRFMDGTTIVADPTPALKAAQAIQGSLTLQDLEPKPEPIPSSGPTKSS